MLMTFGNTSEGTIDDTPNNDAKLVYPVAISNAGLLFKLSGYISGLGAGVGNQPMRCVIYDDLANAPNNLIAQTNEIIIQDGSPYRWYDFWPTAQLRALANSPVWWIGYHAGTPNGGNQIKENSGNSFRYQNAGLNTYSSGPSNPFGTISGTAAGTLTLNVTLDDEANFLASYGRRPVPMIYGPDIDRSLR